jgi:3-oxocholest-4-en-26-oate---CoA ligase
MQHRNASRPADAPATEWTFASVWQTVAEAVPDRIALAHGNQEVSWGDFARRAQLLAASLAEAGLTPGAKLALYLHNGPAYMETMFAALSAQLVPVNTNYRYTGAELAQLWIDADAEGVVFHGTFAAQADALRACCPEIRAWVFVDDGSGPCPDWAIDYAVATRPTGRSASDVSGCTGDDQILIYTGGTTGLPRGVIWRQHDLYLASNAAGDPEVADYDYVRKRIVQSTPPVGLPAAPLMHGTGLVFATTILNRGGTVVTLPGASFDVELLLDTVVARKVTDICIVGDAFCRPIADVLDRDPGRWDITGLKVVSSSGMAWSAEVKERLLVHAPSALLIDFLNSSEASGMGRSLTSNRQKARGARFQLGKNACVIDDTGKPLEPGDPRQGRLAVRGHIPLGYYKDPEKTAATFPVIDGIRYSIPGDLATVDADGAITLLGRGSTSINTGGEKVFPEEVEQAILSWPEVSDALVVGIPHERFGQMVAAVVACDDDAGLDQNGLLDHLRKLLAGHKIPRVMMPVRSIERGPNGKADRPGITQRVIAWIKTRELENAA